MESAEQARRVVKECTYLGRRSDKSIAHSYPTEGNVCYAETSRKRQYWLFSELRPFKHVPLKKQEDVCLNPEKWQICPGYLAAKEKASGGEPES